MYKKETLEDYIESIENEIPYVDLKPYSHNIISSNLRCIAEQFGKETANKIIKNLNLISLGWHIEK